MKFEDHLTGAAKRKNWKKVIWLNVKQRFLLNALKRLFYTLGVRGSFWPPDLARLYGVTTKRLNEQVKRNRDRFPQDFIFQLSAEEKAEVVANCDHLSNLKFSKTLPYAFTEHGAIMAATSHLKNADHVQEQGVSR